MPEDWSPTALMKYEGKSLRQLLSPLVERQRQYLLLRLAGYGREKAKVLAEVRTKDMRGWEDGEYTAIEVYVLGKRDVFQDEALKEYARSIGFKSRMVLEHLLDKGMGWDTLDSEDKKYVMKAVEAVNRLSCGGGEGGEGGSYRELVLKMHEKLGG